jgi:hypothetical protein
MPRRFKSREQILLVLLVGIAVIVTVHELHRGFLATTLSSG